MQIWRPDDDVLADSRNGATARLGRCFGEGVKVLVQNFHVNQDAATDANDRNCTVSNHLPQGIESQGATAVLLVKNCNSFFQPSHSWNAQPAYTSFAFSMAERTRRRSRSQSSFRSIREKFES
nr:MAG TPA: hypothetical protein [Caudoviricetes sp.]